MSKQIDPKERYLSAFAEFEGGVGRNGGGWVHPLRREGMERFAEAGFPTTRQEAWKYTPVAPIARVPFALGSGDGTGSIRAGDLDAFAVGLPDAARLVLVDGLFAPELSRTGAIPKGVVATSLATAVGEMADLVQPHLGRHVEIGRHPFAALNTAFIRDGAFIRIPRGRVLEDPIYLIIVSRGGEHPTVSHPRLLVVAESGSQARIVEAYVGLGDRTTFTNAVTEVVLGEGAHLDHTRIQEEGDAAYHLAATQVSQGRDSSYRSHAISLGGEISRHDLGSLLDGQGIDCSFDGLFLAGGRQLVDNHTCIDHARPHSQSQEIYKGVMGDRSRAVFNGRVVVRKDAQKTNARQTNKNLLLSEDCLVNTKPELEIYADDVKCAHGATIGQLEEEAIFYLRSRGIDLPAARNILTYAFAGEIVESVPLMPLRQRLASSLERRFRSGLLVSGEGS